MNTVFHRISFISRINYLLIFTYQTVFGAAWRRKFSMVDNIRKSKPFSSCFYLLRTFFHLKPFSARSSGVSSCFHQVTISTNCARLRFLYYLLSFLYKWLVKTLPSKKERMNFSQKQTLLKFYYNYLPLGFTDSHCEDTHRYQLIFI